MTEDELNEPQPTVYLIPSSQLPKDLPRYWMTRLGLEASKRCELAGMYYSRLSPRMVQEQIFKTGTQPKQDRWFYLGDVDNWIVYVQHRTSALFYVKLRLKVPVKGKVKRNVYLNLNARKDEFYACPQKEWLSEYEFRQGVNIQSKVIESVKHYYHNLTGEELT